MEENRKFLRFHFRITIPQRFGEINMKKLTLLLLALLLFILPLSALAAQDRAVFDKTVTTLFEGETLQTILQLEGAPAGGTVAYTSSAPHNAAVDGNGLVTGISKGRTTITATVRAGNKTWRAALNLNILRKVSEVQLDETKLPVYQPADEEIALLLTEYTELPVLVLRLGANQQLRATALPQDANDRKVIISTDDETVVSVKGNVLRPLKKGECTLTIASQQNPEVMAQYRVLVVQPVTKLTVEGDGNTIFVGEQLPLTASFTPDNASIPHAVWTSGNESIIAVDENGVVTGMGKGSAYVKATAADGSGKNASYRVQVKQQPEKIELNEMEFIVNMGSYKVLRATVLPQNTNDKAVTWSSSDEKVAKVNASGRITPVSVGHCVITCQSREFPGVYAEANVHVHQLVTKVAFTQKDVSFDVLTSKQLNWTVSPSNATNPAVTFESSKPAIATVDENGLVTGHKKGACNIIVKAADGSGKRATIRVNILQPVKGVHMKNDTLRVGVDEYARATAVLEPSDASNTRMTWHSANTAIATVKGNGTRPTITGRRWGSTVITGVTEDGGFTTQLTVNVGNYDRALKINDLYLKDNKIKIVVHNESNMNVTRFDFTIACFDVHGDPLACTESGSNTFDGSYRLTLYEGDNTQHGRFVFNEFVQPNKKIGMVTMQLTGYRTDSGYRRDIREDKQIVVEYKTAAFLENEENAEEVE